MNWSALTDPLFLTPFLAGLPLVVGLAWLGVLLRLRDEWLAALGLAHLATASGLAGLAAGIPAVLGAPLGALLGAVAKNRSGQRSNSAYALMILAGWSATLLIAANSTLGESLAHAVVDGQLYFAGLRELSLAWLAVGLIFAGLPALSPALLRAHFFPDYERANHLPAWRWHLGFDLMVALGVAAGTTTLGLMASFAFIFIPARLAYRLGGNWRRTLWLSALLGVSGYILSFAAALVLDQPYGPLAVAMLLALSVLFRQTARKV
jgi:zinc/manganese transport system permease protein